jgi:hypothetical protein
MSQAVGTPNPCLNNIFSVLVSHVDEEVIALMTGQLKVPTCLLVFFFDYNKSGQRLLERKGKDS